MAGTASGKSFDVEDPATGKVLLSIVDVKLTMMPKLWDKQSGLGLGKASLEGIEEYLYTQCTGIADPIVG